MFIAPVPVLEYVPARFIEPTPVVEPEPKSIVPAVWEKVEVVPLKLIDGRSVA